MPGQFEISSHEDLGLAANVCRVCNKSFSQSQSRTRHEKDIHKLVISKDNKTLSPVPLPVPRHQSCPTPSQDIFTTPLASRHSSISSRRNLFPELDQSPPVPMSLPTSSTSKMSISTVDSSRSLEVEGEKPGDNPLVCSSCNHQYTNTSSYKRHLPCRYEASKERLQKNENILKLGPPEEKHKVYQLLQHLTCENYIELCITQNWCARDIWPFVFVGAQRSGSGIFDEYTANKQSLYLLKQFLSIKKVISLPKRILIEDTKCDIKSLLSGSLLRPPDEHFTITETEDFYIVTSLGGGGGDGGDGDDGDNDDNDDSSNDESDHDEEKDDEDEDDGDTMSYARQPQPHPFGALGGFQNIQHLLPRSFDPGADGQGQINGHQAAQNRFRSPWQFSSHDLEKLCHLTKCQFFDFVEMVQGAQLRRGSTGINIFSASLLFLLKLSQNWSFEVLATIFVIRDSIHASRIFRNILIFFFKNCINLPAIYDSAGNLNENELDKLLQTARQDSQPYFQTLADAFEDPSGQNRVAVPLNIDATYLATTTSLDLEHQKYVFYVPRSGHCTKLVTLCSLIGKFMAALPLCSSQSPSSGDAYLTATFNRLSNYLEVILRGNRNFFTVLFTDAGLVMESSRMPRVLQGVETLAELCNRVHCVLLHTSDNFSTYHFERTPAGKLRKVLRNDDLITLSENVICFTRKYRKSMEQAHAGIKQQFKILDSKKLPNSFLIPFTDRQRRKFGLEDSFTNVSKLSFIAISCLSLYNRYHPGFGISFMSPAEQVFAARQVLDRMFLENPLHYDIWPMRLTGRSSQWTEVRVGDLSIPGRNVLNFPQCPPHLINPVAVEITGGLNSLTTNNSVLTYVGQLELQGQGLTRQQVLTQLQNFPDFMKIQYCVLVSQPQRWDRTKFGDWPGQVTLVRFAAPPSNKSATQRANYRWPIIAFGTVPSDRLGLRDPYRVIYFWDCKNCPSKCGLLSFCKHLSALLKALSFPDQYRCTARGIDLLNTVVDDTRQVLRILPSSDLSAAIPQNIHRRSVNRRTTIGGVINPLYDTTTSAPTPSNTSAPLAPTTTIPAAPTTTTTSTPTATITTAAATTITTAPPTTITSAPNTTASAPTTTPSAQTISVPPPSSLPATSTVTPATVAPSTSAAVNTGHAGIMKINQYQNKYMLYCVFFAGRLNVNVVSGQQLRVYLRTIPTHGLTPLPAPSLNIPQNLDQFAANHLQTPGLNNVNASCCINSLFFSFHRMLLSLILPPAQQMPQANNQPDYISLVTLEILGAMPSSRSFSLEVFLRIWNAIKPGQQIVPNEDIQGLSDLIYSHLPFLPQPSGAPSITEFLASYNCQCGFQDQNQDFWLPKSFLKLVSLDIGRRSTAVPVGELLTNLIQTPFPVQCALCQNPNAIGRYSVRRGRFTVLRINRINVTNNQNWMTVNRTRLSSNRTQTIGEQYIGELISCISHRGNPQGGHYFAYSFVNGSWFKNSDADRVQRVGYHPFNSNNANETVNFLVYKNI